MVIRSGKRQLWTTVNQSLTFIFNPGYENLVTLFITKGAVINAIDRVGCTPMHYAAANGNFEEKKMKI